MRNALEQVRGVVAVDPHVRLGNADLVVKTDSAAARRIGLSAEQVESQLNAALFGQVAFVLPQEDRLTNVRVRYPDRLRYDLHSLSDMPLLTSDGGTVPLRAVARIEPRRSLNEQWREDQQPTINVTAEIEGRDLGGAARDIQRQLVQSPVPPGYRLELAGDYRSQQQAFRSLLAVLLVAAVLIYLLIERVGQLRHRGLPPEQALATAGRERFRPILITSLTTLLALLSLAFGVGPGAQMQQPLAIAVIGGLMANMLFTRLVIPAGYVLWKGRPR